jgi:2-polyprenyl-3-methyl-5-hydroxy-6-metoxy-1,4-benzoquinol methylase
MMDNEHEPAAQPAAYPANEAARYEREIDVDSDSTHARVVRLVGTDRRVLELGSAAGHMSRVLRERGCSVVGIEVDPEMAALAAPHCERVIVGDLDELDLEAELGDDHFDVIVAADVLEHLKDPLAVLRRMRGFLAPKGHFVISLPNVAHGSVRLALLEGRFAYQRAGLLDETHLRFFTRESIEDLLDQAELGIAELYRQELSIDASEVCFDSEAAPAEVRRALEQDPEALTYQFVIKAIPFDVGGLREVQRRMRELVQENARLREAASTAENYVSSREGQLRAALIDAHDQLLRRDEELQRLHEELQAAQATIAEQQEQLMQLRVRLERIWASPPARAYAKLRGLPFFSQLASRRTAAYQAAVRGGQGSDSPASEQTHG